MQIIINALALSYSKILKLAWFCNLKLIELLVMVLNFNKQLIGRLKMVKMCNYIFNKVMILIIDLQIEGNVKFSS